MTETMHGSELSRRNLLRTSALAVGAAALPAALAACGGDDNPAASGSPGAGGAAKTPFNFNLGFVPNGRNAPFYYGKKLGLYSDRGLDVTIEPSSGTGAVLKLLSAGRTDMSILSSSAMLNLMAKTPEPAMKAYATIYVKNTASIFFIKGKGIETPKDLEGKTIATSAGSNEQRLFPVIAAANGVDASKVSWKVVDPSVKTGLILTGTVDATSTTIYGLAQLEAKAKPGEEIGYFVYGDYGVAGDTTVLGATVDTAENKKPEATKAFVEGSMEAFKRALADPQAAVDAMRAEVPTLDPKVGLAEMKILATLAAGPQQKEHGLGWNVDADFKATYELVEKYFDVSFSKPYTDYFSNAYIGSVMP